MAYSLSQSIAATTAAYVTEDTYIKGGYHSVNSITERNSIVATRLKVGEIVYTVEDDKCWILKELIVNPNDMMDYTATWVEWKPTTIATTTTLGGVIVGTGLSVDANGVLSVEGSSQSNTTNFIGSSAEALVTIANNGTGIGLSVDDLTASIGITANNIATANGNINSASLTTSTTVSDQVVDTTPTTIGRTIKYVIQVTAGTSYQTSEILSIHNGTDVKYTESSMIYTDSPLARFRMDVSGGNVRLLVTPLNDVTVIKVIKTYINI